MDQHKPLRENYKKKQRKAVLKLVSLLLVVATLIATAAWSWFRDPNNTHAKVTGTFVSIKSEDPLLEMSVNDGSYTTSLDITDGNGFLRDLDMVPVMGLGYKIGSTTGKVKAGETYLYIPSLSYNNDGTAYVPSGSEWKNAEPNVDYISLKIKFRSKSEIDVYIASGTSVVTECEKTGKSLVGEDAGNKSIYGPFSRDASVGALRMSVCYPEETLQCLWIPRPDVELSKNADGYTLKRVSSGNWLGRHYYYKTDGEYTYEEKRCVLYSSAFTATSSEAGAAGTVARVGSKDNQVREGDYYTYTTYIKIWFDGCDTEAVRALSRGRFKINLGFVAIERTTG